MANGEQCTVCGWTQTAHDMAVVYKERHWYWWCLHPFTTEPQPEPDQEAHHQHQRASTDLASS